MVGTGFVCNKVVKGSNMYSDFIKNWEQFKTVVRILILLILFGLPNTYGQDETKAWESIRNSMTTLDTLRTANDHYDFLMYPENYKDFINIMIRTPHAEAKLQINNSKRRLRNIIQRNSVFYIWDWHSKLEAVKNVYEVSEELKRRHHKVVFLVEQFDQRSMEYWKRYKTGKIDIIEFKKEVWDKGNWKHIAWPKFRDYFEYIKVNDFDVVPGNKSDVNWKKVDARDKAATTRLEKYMQRNPNAKVIAFYGDRHIMGFDMLSAKIRANPNMEHLRPVTIYPGTFRLHLDTLYRFGKLDWTGSSFYGVSLNTDRPTSIGERWFENIYYRPLADFLSWFKEDIGSVESVLYAEDKKERPHTDKIVDVVAQIIKAIEEGKREEIARLGLDRQLQKEIVSLRVSIENANVAKKRQTRVNKVANPFFTQKYKDVLLRAFGGQPNKCNKTVGSIF